jgi:uncharacterized protein (TIGR03435 family)
MFMQLHCGRRPSSMPFSVMLLACAAILHLHAQAGVTAPQIPIVKVPAYEVVSIKPSDPGDRNSGWKDLPNGLDFTNGALVWLIYEAYGISSDNQISGLPEWVKTDRYNVSARADEETVEAWKKLSDQDRQKQQQLMLQTLFAERCQLKIRREMKELPVYNLVIAKAGSKLKESPPDEKGYISIDTTSSYSETNQGVEYTKTLNAHAVTSQGLAGNLPYYAGRIVIDKTGLGEKKFDFELKWSSSQEAPVDSGGTGPSVFKALEEELGLQLVPAREPVDTFVVERMERPSAN